MVLQYDHEILETDGGPAPDIDFPPEDHDLLASRLIGVGNLLRRGATQRFHDVFGLSPTESLIVVQLAADAPLSVNELAARTGLYQTQASTVITRLSTGGLVTRTKNPCNGRQVHLSLPPRGRTIFNAIFQNWLNKELVLELTPSDVATLNDLLDRVAIMARKLLEQEPEELE